MSKIQESVILGRTALRNPLAPPLGTNAVFVITSNGIPYLVDKHGRRLHGVKNFSISYSDSSVMTIKAEFLVPTSKMIPDGVKGVVYSGELDV